MKAQDFCYWLMGYFELNAPGVIQPLSQAQTERIKRHLDLVFMHDIDPSHGPKELQEKLDGIHNKDLPAWQQTHTGDGPRPRC